MINQPQLQDEGYIGRAREVFIRIGLLAITAVACFWLLRPFLNMLISGIIIAIAIYPGHRMLTNVLRGRNIMAAVLCAALLLLVLSLPCILLAGTLTEGIRAVSHDLQAGRLSVPSPPASLDKLPLVGARLKELWSLCSTNLSEVVTRFRPQIQERIPELLSASADIAGALLQFLVSVLLAGFMLANSAGNARFADRIFVRIFGDQGPEFKDLVSATIRSVTNGILGVAVIQSLFASLGFWFVGLPGAGLWAIIFLIASVLQIGIVVLIPAVLYGFATFSTTHAAIFLAWCAFVGLMDNVLKPILLGRGSKVPMGVIFLGVLGGFIAMRLVGLFVGAIILSVGYKLFIAWLDTGSTQVIGSQVPARKAS